MLKTNITKKLKRIYLINRAKYDNIVSVNLNFNGGRIPPVFENMGKSFQFRNMKTQNRELKTFCILRQMK